jgi:hypothetical protein
MGITITLIFRYGKIGDRYFLRNYAVELRGFKFLRKQRRNNYEEIYYKIASFLGGLGTNLSNITDSSPKSRPSCKKILNGKSDWLIEIKHITDEPLLYEAYESVNQNDIDSVVQNPVSHILYHKLRMSKESEIEEFEKRKDNRNYWTTERYNLVSDVIRSDQFLIDSNLDDRIEPQIIMIINRAFIVHSIPPLIRDLIKENIQKCDYVIPDNCEWECLFHGQTRINTSLNIDQIGDYKWFKEFKWINWECTQYLRVLCENVFGPYPIALFIYLITHKKDISMEPKIIINEYDDHTTDALIQFFGDTQKTHYFDIDDKNNIQFESEYHNNVQTLTSIVTDDHSFYYISKDKHFLFYRETYSKICKVSCKFAATIGELHCAVFIYQCDRRKLYLSFCRYDDYFSEMRISIHHNERYVASMTPSLASKGN